MKKSISCLAISCLVLVLFFAGGASAATKLLPNGTVVSAKVNAKKGIAYISVRGVIPVRVEFYSYGGTNMYIGSTNNFNVNLNSTRRFNFKFKAADGKSYYALLTPEMSYYPPSFFGKGIGLDCSNVDGCVFLITGK